MTGHDTVRVRHGNNEADIDVGIADLILEIWKADIDTLNSCEDNVPSGWVWIKFFDACSAERFLSIAAGIYEEDKDFNCLYQRIHRVWDCPRTNLENDWKYDVGIFDMSMNYIDHGDGTAEASADNPADISLSISVRFPKSDQEEVLSRLQQHNTQLEDRRRCACCHEPIV